MSKNVMYFSAQWCGPCKSYKPKFQKISEDHSDKATFSVIDIDDQPELCQEHGIRGVPTVVVTEDGKEIDRGVGVVQIDKVLEFLKV